MIFLSRTNITILKCPLSWFQKESYISRTQQKSISYKDWDFKNTVFKKHVNCLLIVSTLMYPFSIQCYIPATSILLYLHLRNIAKGKVKPISLLHTLFTVTLYLRNCTKAVSGFIKAHQIVQVCR